MRAPWSLPWRLWPGWRHQILGRVLLRGFRRMSLCRAHRSNLPVECIFEQKSWNFHNKRDCGRPSSLSNISKMSEPHGLRNVEAQRARKKRCCDKIGDFQAHYLVRIMKHSAIGFKFGKTTGNLSCDQSSQSTHVCLLNYQLNFLEVMLD